MYLLADWGWYEVLTTLSTIIGLTAFVAVVIRAYWRPQQQVEADARLWMDD